MQLGLRTYGMLCPLMPGIADSPEQIDELVTFVKDCGAEEIFAEAVNPRGGGLRDTAEALREAGFKEEADSVSRIRKRSHWSAYVTRLIQTLQSSLRRHGLIEKFRFLLYPSHLLPADRAAIESDDAGVVWL